VLLSATDEDIDDTASGASDEEVIEAAKALAAELDAAQGESTPFQFTSILMQCNEAISEETGIDYGSACGAGGSC